MGRIFWKIVLAILPALLVIGLFRVVIHPGQSFLPTGEELIVMFSSAPDFQSFIADSLKAFSSAAFSVSESWGSVNDISSFFAAIGNFFTAVGAFFVMVWNAIRFPFEFMGFVFSTILGLG